jgi:hypothetical protein
MAELGRALADTIAKTRPRPTRIVAINDMLANPEIATGEFLFQPALVVRGSVAAARAAISRRQRLRLAGQINRRSLR